MSSANTDTLNPEKGYITRRAPIHRQVEIPRLKVSPEVEAAMATAIRLILDSNVSYREATEAFQTKLVTTAIQDKNGVVAQAAHHLRMNVGWAWKIMRSLAFQGKRHR